MEGATIVLLENVQVEEITKAGDIVLRITSEQQAELLAILKQRQSRNVPGAYPYCSFRSKNRLLVPNKKHPRDALILGKMREVRFGIALQPNRKIYEDYIISKW